MPARQRGLALITAMLVVAIAATTAAYLSLDQQIWLRQAQNLSDRAQAEVVRAGALEWAITILAKDAKDNKSDDLTENWAKPLPPLAVEGGQVTGRIADAQARFNINNLVRNNAPSKPDIGTFRHLLLSLSIDPNLTDAVVDWIDADSDKLPYGAEDIDYLQTKIPYRAANQPMQSVDELRLVRGFTPEIVEKLRPWITALPQPTEINVNTASKEVLGALFYTLPPPAIEQLVSQRPYTDPGKLTQILQGLATGTALPQAFYGIQSSYFEVVVETRFGRYQRTTQALIHRGSNDNASRILWHRQLLPRIATTTETASPAENSGVSSDRNI
ncbi:MAG: type II secretion system minor pseudopilin GspK [Gammaproteobacteria bacterium]|nr:type II secretion system minor pseudopilin GspK [Gammaproteobacteria bacterium]